MLIDTKKNELKYVKRNLNNKVELSAEFHWPKVRRGFVEIG